MQQSNTGAVEIPLLFLSCYLIGQQYYTGVLLTEKKALFSCISYSRLACTLPWKLIKGCS